MEDLSLEAMDGLEEVFWRTCARVVSVGVGVVVPSVVVCFLFCDEEGATDVVGFSVGTLTRFPGGNRPLYLNKEKSMFFHGHKLLIFATKEAENRNENRSHPFLEVGFFLKVI